MENRTLCARNNPEAPANHGGQAEPQSYLAAIFESSNDAIIGVDLAGMITSWNHAAEDIFGYKASEVLGRHVTLMLPEERAGEDKEILGRVWSGERVAHHETVRLRRNGSRVNISLTVSPIRNVAGGIVGAAKIARDLTEQKKIKEIAAQMRLAIEAAPNGMVMVDERGAITMVNSQLERMFGYDRAEMLGRTIEMLLPGRFREAHPGQRKDYLRSAETRAMGHGRDLFARRKDGTEFPVEVGLNPAATPEGTFVLAAVIDITARKRMEAELAKVHADLRDHAQTLEATVAERTAHLQQIIAELETVSYSLSHDLRGPLRTIQGFSQIVLADAAARLRPEEKELLAKSIKAANRLDRLIQDVLAYARVSRQKLVLQTVHVEPLVRQIIDEHPEFQPPKAELVIERPLAPVRGHEASLTQVITNLLDNAVKFMPLGRRPRIRIRSEKDGDHVALWFEDNGIGIPREAQTRLFAIFQRVHDEKTYPGTGIGLAIVRKAVERMGGTVRVESEPGAGSRFCVRLPQGGTS
jgi:PAS domain S-box-containing protein